MNLQKIIEKHWYKKDTALSKICLNILLLPLSCIFFLIASARRQMYKLGIFKSFKLPVPVVIIGNITVGGSGKTPLTQHIACELLKNNFRAGVILRGYKSKTLDATVVNRNDEPDIVGDEALIYASNNIPVAIGRNRYQTGLKLLEQYPDIDIILSDDGMQHYRLQRDYEIAVIDESRILGNKYVLPNGPLREPAFRLREVDAIVVNSQKDIAETWFTDNLNLNTSNSPKSPNSSNLNSHILNSQLQIIQKLVLEKIYNPKTGTLITVAELKNKSVIAMAAIGNPQRFFKFISDNGISITQTLTFPDHYYYQASDIPTNYDIILTSDKDYTKLARFNHNNIYVIKVSSQLSDNKLITDIMNI